MSDAKEELKHFIGVTEQNYLSGIKDQCVRDDTQIRLAFLSGISMAANVLSSNEGSESVSPQLMLAALTEYSREAGFGFQRIT